MDFPHVSHVTCALISTTDYEIENIPHMEMKSHLFGFLKKFTIFGNEKSFIWLSKEIHHIWKK